MTQTICRMYSNPEQAAAAAAELLDVGFERVHKFSAANGSSNSDSLVDEMEKAYIPSYHAQIYARSLMKGAALVAVHAPFGDAYIATKMLENHGPIESGVIEPASRSVAWDERTPMSSAVLMPVLAKNRHPFEKVWNVRSLTRKPYAYSACLGVPMKSKSANPLSSTFGLPTLSKSRRFFYKTKTT